MTCMDNATQIGKCGMDPWFAKLGWGWTDVAGAQGQGSKENHMLSLVCTVSFKGMLRLAKDTKQEHNRGSASYLIRIVVVERRKSYR